MAEVQVTNWREIPSFITAREGQEIVKVQLPQRFQEAIDEAAMRSDAADSDAYMEGWLRGEWVTVAGSVTEAAESVAAQLEAQWSPEALDAYLAACGPT